VREVKDGVFPDDDHSYGAPAETVDRFRDLIEKRRQI